MEHSHDSFGDPLKSAITSGNPISIETKTATYHAVRPLAMNDVYIVVDVANAKTGLTHRAIIPWVAVESMSIGE
jgi:hypothetical protein